MVSLFRRLHLRPNLNLEPFQASAIGMAEWPGIVPTANRLASRLSRIPIAISLGASADSMAILHTMRLVIMRCRRLIENGTSTRKASHRHPRSFLHHFDPRLPCPDPNVVFVLGGPGAGKGTMCELAESQLGWIHLSTGDLLRAELSAGGPTAATIDECLTAGKLVPNEIIVGLLKIAMESGHSYDRKEELPSRWFSSLPQQLGSLETRYSVESPEIPKMLYFECPFDVLEKRILGRAKYTGRSDDNIESIKLRFDTFKSETLPTVEHFKSLNRCVEIDTSQDRQAVYAQVVGSLADFTVESPSCCQTRSSERAEMLLGLRPFPKQEK